jgi:hypothetical protein
MLQPAHQTLIATIVDSGMAPNIDLVYNSNLTILPKFDIAVFRKFKSVEIGASCDGTGAVYESIRRGGHWQDFERNVSLFSQYARIRIAATPQRDNIEHLGDLIEWSKTNGYRIDLTNILQHPAHLALTGLPAHVKNGCVIRYTELARYYGAAGDTRLAEELNAVVNTLSAPSSVSSLVVLGNHQN